jgi:hypothetical protein
MRLPWTALFLASACAHTDLTAAENRNEAAIHRARAREEQSQFDPLQQQRPLRQGALNPTDGAMVPEFSYSPTESHLFSADAEFRAANEHLRVANTLESYEDAACRDVPTGQRAACPLLGSYVREVRHTPTGFELVMKPDVDVGDVSRKLDCHLAYARSVGFDRPSCPLFIRGLSLRRERTDAIAFAGDTRAIALELQAQADRVFSRSLKR